MDCSPSERQGFLDAIAIAKQITAIPNLVLPADLVRDVDAICNCFEANG
jgi:hypothetical protein